jgi:hypothetical protein
MRLRVTIEGMLSVHAKKAVFTALAGVEDVRSAEVELGTALLDCDPGVSADAVRAAIEGVGCRLVSIVRELPTV